MHLLQSLSGEVQHGVVLIDTSVAVICGGGEHPANPDLARACSDVDLKRTELETGLL